MGNRQANRMSRSQSQDLGAQKVKKYTGYPSSNTHNLRNQHISLSEPNLLDAPTSATSNLSSSRTATSDPGIGNQTHADTMPKNKSKGENGKTGQNEQASYMPGMKEKKKKGIFSIFTKRKGGKFNVSAETHDTSYRAAPPPSNRASVAVTSSAPSAHAPDVSVRPKSEYIHSTNQSELSSASSHTSSLGRSVPAKPPRKKRQAPLPPPQQKDPESSNKLQVETNVKIDTSQLHSRSSSHSSGYGEGSPLESPGINSREAVEQKGSGASGKISIDATSVESGEVRPVDGSVLHARSPAAAVPSNSGDESFTSTLGRKKRRAPPPPGAGAASVHSTESTPTHNAMVTVTPATSTPIRAGHENDDEDDVLQVTSIVESPDVSAEKEDLHSAVVEELKNGPQLPPMVPDDSPDGSTTSLPTPPVEFADKHLSPTRPCQFIAPPPPDTPPPPDNYSPVEAEDGVFSYGRGAVKVAESSTQVHVTLRDSLSSETQEHNIHSMDYDFEDVIPYGVESLSAQFRTDPSQKSDVATFVEQMEELTENVNVDLEENPDLQLSSPRSSRSSPPQSPGGSIQQEKEVTSEDKDVEESPRVVQMIEVKQNVETLRYETEVLSINEDAQKQTDFEIEKPIVLKKARKASRSDSESSSSISSSIMKEVESASDSEEESPVVGSGSAEVVLLKHQKSTESPEKVTEANVTQEDVGEVVIRKKVLAAPADLFINKDEFLESDGSDSESLSPRSSMYDKVRTSQTVGGEVGQQEMDKAISAFDHVEDDTQEALPVIEEATIEYDKANIESLSKSRVDVEPLSSYRMGFVPQGGITKDSDEGEINFDHLEVEFVEPPPPQITKDISENENKNNNIRTFTQDSLRSRYSETHDFTTLRDSSKDDTEQDFIVPEIPLPKKKEHIQDNVSHLHNYEVSAHPSLQTTELFCEAPPGYEESTRDVEIEKDIMITEDIDQDSAESDVEVEQEEFNVPLFPVPKRKDNASPVQEQNIYANNLRQIMQNSAAQHQRETIVISKTQPLPVFIKDSPVKKKGDFGPSVFLPPQPRTEQVKVKTEEVKVSAPSPSFKVRNVITTNTVNDVESKPSVSDADRKKISFWGPRPWNARTKSEPNVKDVRRALNIVQQFESKAAENQTSPPVDINKNRVSVGDVAAESPQYRPVQFDSPKDKVSKISFDPQSEMEPQQEMEEKSISMRVLPVERKTVTGTNSTFTKPEPGNTQHYHSMGSLEVPSEGEPPKTVTTQSSENLAPDALKNKKSLQAQYDELQDQFTRWQKQIMENQALLARKKLIEAEAEEKPRDTEPKLEPEPVFEKVVEKEPLRKVSSDATETKSYARNIQTRPRMSRPTSLTETPTNASLGGLFTKEELAEGKTRLRQKSVEEQPKSVRFNGDGTKRSILKNSRAKSVGSFSIGSAYHGVTLQTAPSQPSHVTQAPPPAPPPPQAPPTVTTTTRKPATSRPRQQIEPQLDPREELMIAIRNTGGMAALRKVPVSETRW